MKNKNKKVTFERKKKKEYRGKKENVKKLQKNIYKITTFYPHTLYIKISTLYMWLTSIQRSCITFIYISHMCHLCYSSSACDGGT